MSLLFLSGDLILFGILFELQALALLGLLLQPQTSISSNTTQVKANASAALYLLGYTLLSGSFYAYGSYQVYDLYGTTSIYLLQDITLPDSIYMCFFIAGAIKLALAPFHI